MFKQTDTPTDKYVTFYDFHSIRYTFVRNFFKYYDVLDNNFENQIKTLNPISIWNIYKSLTVEVQQKIVDIKYGDL